MFFFKQKTAFEVRISDWSSDVCSSDLIFPDGYDSTKMFWFVDGKTAYGGRAALLPLLLSILKDRKSVVSGKSVSVRVDLGGRCIINKKKQTARGITISITSIKPTYCHYHCTQSRTHNCMHYNSQ